MKASAQDPSAVRTTSSVGIDREAVKRLADEPIPVGTKGWPARSWGRSVRSVINERVPVLGGDVPMPVAVLDAAALTHNARLMSRWASKRGAALAPHVKTTMSPELMALQVEHGAWAMTAATPVHAQVYAAFGVDRIFYANEIVEASLVAWIAEQQRARDDFEVLTLVDSVNGVRWLDRELQRHGGRPLGVLIEVGVAGWRTGVRSVATAFEVARAVTASMTLRLVGVEAFEGMTLGAGLDESMQKVDALLGLVSEVAEAVGAMVEGPLVLSAGGSLFFDRVTEHARTLDCRWSLVLRSGAYLIHDGGITHRLSPLDGRASEHETERLRPALEVWSAVLSRPEPGLAITSMGKRDVGHDVELPTPTRSARNGLLRPVAEDARIVALSDQHAHVHIDPASDLRAGDRLSCMVSHPCTTMDRWRLLPIVDRELRIVDAAHTLF